MNRRSELRRVPMPPRKSPLRSTGWKRYVLPDASMRICRRSPLPAVSAKRRAQNRSYSEQRRVYLEANPWCQSPANCGQPATEVQHRRGRRGERLLDQAWWAPSCHDCNMRAESDTGWALATGWLVRIEGEAA